MEKNYTVVLECPNCKHQFSKQFLKGTRAYTSGEACPNCLVKEIPNCKFRVISNKKQELLLE